MSEIVSFDEFTRIFEASQQNLEKLTDAVTNKFICVIDYRGEPDSKGLVDSGLRHIEPVVIGTNRLGNTLVRGWLIKGTSRTGKADPSLVPGWRLYRLDRIFNITPTLETFEERKGYNSKDRKMTDIIISATF